MKRNFILSIAALCLFALSVNAQTEDKFERNVLLEEFTTERCPNCPAAATLVEQLLVKADYKDRVIALSHHAGFGSDSFTTDADSEYLFFYNSSQIYAPAMMFDRYPYFVDYYNQYYGNETPVNFISSYKELEKYVDKSLKRKSNVGFDITADYNGGRKVVVTVKGEKTDDFTAQNPRIFVYISENRVPSIAQSGANKGYKHRHMMRAYNKTWGEEITWEGNSFEYTCNIYIDEEWNQDEMSIVACVSEFDAEDPTNCAIENTRAIPFTSVTNGIESASDDKQLVKTEYYTTDGIKTDVLNNGMYIEKKFYTDGTQEIKKITK